jgi:hypothetical protein
MALRLAAAAQDESVFPDPGLRNPMLLFHTGRAVPGRGPEISDVAPDIPGRPSGWYIAQWRKSEILGAQSLKLDDPQTRDDSLGIAAWSFATPNGESRVAIYPQG